ncbi:MAG: ABC transporter permease [Planctomycetia bacterium]|nr:MAG: ABC transporter permease [Planctomycetia bacterium]
MALPLRYHWRNLLVRRTTSALTILVVTAVVGTLTWILGFFLALQASLSVAGDPHKLLIIQRGTTSETNSAISPEEFNRLAQLAGVALSTESGEPLISPELYWQTQLPRLRDGGKTRANVALRGVTMRAFEVHRNIRLLGECFSVGEPQVIVGRAAATQFAGLSVGDVIRIGVGESREFRVVGHFDAGGGPMESEIWMYLPAMQSAYLRNGYSSAAVRLNNPASASAAIEQVRSAPIELSAEREADYWQSQTSNVRFYQAVCFVLVAIMSLAAAFALANTMYASVAGRAREIAMLRTIGYRPFQILLGFVLESVLLSLVGGALGCIACAAYLELVGSTKDMFGSSTFTTMAFDIRLTPLLVGWSLASVAAIGVIGALPPAWRAAQTHVLTALREP